MGTAFTPTEAMKATKVRALESDAPLVTSFAFVSAPSAPRPHRDSECGVDLRVLKALGSAFSRRSPSGSASRSLPGWRACLPSLPARGPVRPRRSIDETFGGYLAGAEPRAACPRCGTEVAVTNDRLVRAHQPSEREQPPFGSADRELTAREREAAGWAEQGMANAAIARQMGVSRSRVSQLLRQAQAKQYS